MKILSKFRITIADVLTLLGLVLGISAILIAPDHLEIAARLLLFAACIDMADGMVARKLKVESRMGQILDSISDEISFCLAPAFILYSFLDLNVYLIGSLVYLVSICGALRLARFAISESKDIFEGLPSPAFAMSISALIIAEIYNIRYGEYIIFTLAVVISLLMVSNYEYLKVGRMGKKYSKRSVDAIINIFASLMVIILIFELFYPYILSMIIPYLFLFFVLFYVFGGHFLYKFQVYAFSKIAKEQINET